MFKTTFGILALSVTTLASAAEIEFSNEQYAESQANIASAIICDCYNAYTKMGEVVFLPGQNAIAQCNQLYKTTTSVQNCRAV